MIDVSSPESYPKWVGYVPNDELKLITLLAVDNADKPLTATALVGEINSYQGGVVAFANSIPSQYCSDGLAPASFTTEVATTHLRFGHKSMPAIGHIATKEGEGVGRSVAIDLLDWSSDFPNLSLRPVAGEVSHAGVVAHIETRVHVYKRLLAVPNGLSLRALFDGLKVSGGAASALIAEMASEEIVTRTSNLERNQRTIRILESTYTRQPRGTNFDVLAPEVQLLFRSLKVAKKFKEVWVFDDFLEIAEAIAEDELIIRKLRKRLSTALSPSVTTFDRYVINESGPVMGKGDVQTNIVLNPSVSAAVKGFVDIIDAHKDVEAGTVLVEDGRVNQKLNDTETIIDLIAKSREASGKATRNPQIEQKIAELVLSSTSPMTVKDVHAKIQDPGTKISLQTVSLCLLRLSRAGVLQTERYPNSNGRKQLRPVYTAS